MRMKMLGVREEASRREIQAVLGGKQLGRNCGSEGLAVSLHHAQNNRGGLAVA
jgi:hypothetical protein